MEKNKFKWPRKVKGDVLNLSTQQWQWLLEGLDITLMKASVNRKQKMAIMSEEVLGLMTYA
ncbi:hypothetical protein C5610_05675 [Idiomarina sp. OT37-5b]|nr:hypothetical protein C5610_05675 [Idiomarina sp. OT37-5b]